MNIEDARWVRACTRGDTNALAALHRRYHRAVVNHLYRMVWDRQAAEDLAEETFFRVWRKAHLYDPRKGAFRTWLMQMATRLAFNLLKREARRARRAGPVLSLEAVDPAGGVRGPAEAASLAEERRLVRRALRDLSPRDRAVLLLRHFQGMDEAAVARALGIPRGTVKSRTFYALRRLRDVLEGYGVAGTTAP